MPSVKEWIAIGAFVAFVLMPICWKFWRGWDRPSAAARAEMKRRKREREIRDAFMREDAKMREQERIAAEMSLSRRKAQAPAPVAKGVLTDAFGSLGESAAAVAPAEPEPVNHAAFEVNEVEDVSDLVSGLDTADVEDSVIPEAAPVAVQIQPSAPAADEVEWTGEDAEDDWSEIGWS